MRLINADKLKEHIDKLPALPDGNFAGNHSALKALINMQQTIEPEIKTDGDTISRRAAIMLPVMPKEHREYQTHNLDDAYEQGWFDLQKCIEKLPSAQPEREPNEWVAYGDIPKECPFCGEDWDKYVFGDVEYKGELPKFCPNCGRMMKGKENG